jgi:FtsH-binding integral membrane protein
LQKLGIGVMFVGFIAAIILNYSYRNDVAGIIAWLGSLVGIGILLVHSKQQEQMRNFAFFFVCFILSLTGVFFI